MSTSFDSIEHALEAIRAGKMIVVVDDEDRENEGDVVMAAQHAGAEAINFMAKHARGLICLSLTAERIKQLNLSMMVQNNASPHQTAFTVSIEAREGVTTGISAQDRARTVAAAIADDASATDIVSPGHIFPLKAKEGGVLVRSGHTEASVDLAKMAGLQPAGVICEIMNEDGTMARLPELRAFAAEHRLPLISIEQLIAYRSQNESLVKILVQRAVQHPQWGDVVLYVFGTELDDKQHLAVVKGDLHAPDASAPLIRVHSGYPFSHVFGDLFSHDRRRLNAALKRLGEEGRGVLLCLDHGTGGLPLDQRVKNLGEAPAPTKREQVQKEIGIGAQILRTLGLKHLRILTDRPRRLAGLSGYGLHIDEEVPLTSGPSTL